MSENFERLKAHILPLSEEQRYFEKAKREWKLVGVELSEELDNCPCGQEIREHCYIENTINGNRTYVGNVCINQFIGIDTGNLFAGIRRITKDVSANANEDLIEHAYRFGYIYESEHKFLMETRHKRKLSEKQLAWKQKINRRITNRIVVQKRTKHPQ
ncbi:MAG TPA: hypothetical protein VGI90_14430 [Steroidobacteraceae bacterium]